MISYYNTSILKLNKMKAIFFINKRVFLSLFLFFILMGLAVDPAPYIKSTYNGLVVFCTIIVPSLLPFFVFTKLLTSLQVINDLCNIFNPITKFLFKAPAISSYIFLVSILSGYPVGAKLVSECYKEGFITKEEAKKIITFTSNTGPMFIMGTVGASLLLSKEAGFLILLSHILGSVLNGILYRTIKTHKNTPTLLQKTFSLNNI